DNAPATLTGKAKVTMPIPDGFVVDKLAVFRVEADGTLTAIETTNADGKLSFETDKFGLCVIGQLEAAPVKVDSSSSKPIETPKKSNATMWIIIGVIVAVAIIGGGACYYFLVMKKKDNEEVTEETDEDNDNK
ncbi:MAG: DUF4366 domain-containing protein, partial [Clostridia bacterium]